MGNLKGEVEEVEIVEEKGIEMIRDVIILILVRLPVNSLLRFKCVSKFWYSLITSPRFVKMHLNHTHTQNNNPIILLRSSNFKSLYALTYTGSATSPVLETKEIDYPFKSFQSQFEIYGSCNGLLLIRVLAPARYLCLFNPSTKEYTQLPNHNYKIDVAATDDDDMVSYGFGFNRTMDEHMVIRLHAVNTIDKRFVSIVEVCRRRHWRRIQPLPYSWPSQPLISGVHVNGALHWRVNMSSQPQTPCHKIFSFDIGDEEYRDVSRPPCIDTVPYPRLCVLRGCLSILINNDDPKVTVDVWMMMNYGVGESWTKLITITQSSLSFFPRVLWLCKNGEVLTDIALENAYVYDPESEKARVISQCVPNLHSVGAYIESLASPDSRTYTLGQSCRRGESNHVSIFDALQIDPKPVKESGERSQMPILDALRIDPKPVKQRSYRRGYGRHR